VSFDNATLNFAAVAAGTAGNSITIAFDSAANTALTTATRNGNDIVVHLATNAQGSVTATVDDVVSAVNLGAAALVAASKVITHTTATIQHHGQATLIVNPGEAGKEIKLDAKQAARRATSSRSRSRRRPRPARSSRS